MAGTIQSRPAFHFRGAIEQSQRPVVAQRADIRDRPDLPVGLSNRLSGKSRLDCRSQLVNRQKMPESSHTQIIHCYMTVSIVDDNLTTDRRMAILTFQTDQGGVGAPWLSTHQTHPTQPSPARAARRVLRFLPAHSP